LKSIDSTGTTGAVTAAIDGTLTTYAGGAGKDAVTLLTGTALTKAINLGAGDDTLVFGAAVTGSTAVLNGGDGVDTLSMSAANADTLDASKQTFYTGFERLTINNAPGTDDATATTLTLNLDNLGFTNYVTTSGTVFGTAGNAGTNDTLVLDKLTTNGTVVLTATGLVTVNVTDAALVASTADVLNVVLSSTGNLSAGTLTAANVETINISTVDTEAAPQTKNVNTLTLTADKATAVNLTGAADLTLTMTDSTKVISIDGSTMTGGLTVTSLNTTAATTIKGGSGNDVLTAAVGTTADVLQGGAGSDTLVANAGLSTLTGGAGNDIFKIGTASLNVNSYATITDFAAGDLLEMTGISAFKSAAVTLGGTAVFQDFANAAINSLADTEAGWFQFGGDTYVVADLGLTFSTSFVNTEDFIVKITGAVDLSNASFNDTFDTIALV
jgi:S-layer protein